jgi:hypothetical protein
MTIAAYTAPTGAGFPPYFNARRDGDEVAITVRSPAGRLPCGAACEGPTGTMRMPLEEFRRLHAEMGAAL